MIITKKQGAQLTLVIVSVYTFMYFRFVKEAEYALQLTGIFFIGMLFIFLHKVEEGTERRLAFLGKLQYDKTGNPATWSDGFCLVPAFLPVLHHIELFVLWRLLPLQTSEEAPYRPNVDITTYTNQREINYRINSNVTFWQLTISKITGDIFRWLFKFEKNDELRYQGIGTRIILVMLAVGWLSTFRVDDLVVPAKQALQEKIDQLSAGPPGPQVLVNLVTRGMPVFPDASVFVPTTDETQKFADVIGNTTYIRYQLLSGDQLPKVAPLKHSDNVCVVVPTGKEILIETASPPATVVNMDTMVEYTPKNELATVWEKIWSNPRRTNGWRYFRGNWGEVDTRYMLRAKAHPPVQATPSTSLGGLVCFL